MTEWVRRLLARELGEVGCYNCEHQTGPAEFCKSCTLAGLKWQLSREQCRELAEAIGRKADCNR